MAVLARQRQQVDIDGHHAQLFSGNRSLLNEACSALVGWALPTIPYRLAHVAQTTIMAGGTWIALRKFRSIQATPALVGWALPTIPYRLAHVAQTTIKAYKLLVLQRAI